MKPRFNDISRLFLSLLLHVLQAWQMMPKCLKKLTKGVPKLHIVDGSAQIEKLRFDCAGASGSRVRHAGKHVKANKNYTQTNTRRIHDFFVKSDTKDCQNGHRFSPHFTMISSVIFQHLKKQKIEMAAESRRGHLGHIESKGGTGEHLGGIWGLLEGSGKNLGSLSVDLGCLWGLGS